MNDDRAEIGLKKSKSVTFDQMFPLVGYPLSISDAYFWPLIALKIFVLAAFTPPDGAHQGEGRERDGYYLSDSH